MVEAELRMRINEGQFGFMPRKNTTDPVNALRMFMKKHREGQKELYCQFVGLENS